MNKNTNMIEFYHIKPKDNAYTFLVFDGTDYLQIDKADTSNPYCHSLLFSSNQEAQTYINDHLNPETYEVDCVLIDKSWYDKNINQIVVNNSDIKPYKIKPIYDEYYIDYTGLEAKVTLIDNYNRKILLTQLPYSLLSGFEFAMKRFEATRLNETLTNQRMSNASSNNWEIINERVD